MGSFRFVTSCLQLPCNLLTSAENVAVPVDHLFPIFKFLGICDIGKFGPWVGSGWDPFRNLP